MNILNVIFTFARFILHCALVHNIPGDFSYNLPPAGREPSAHRKNPVFPWIPTKSG